MAQERFEYLAWENVVRDCSCDSLFNTDLAASDKVCSERIPKNYSRETTYSPGQGARFAREINHKHVPQGEKISSLTARINQHLSSY